jgi:hypothetical protein
VDGAPDAKYKCGQLSHLYYQAVNESLYQPVKEQGNYYKSIQFIVYAV